VLVYYQPSDWQPYVQLEKKRSEEESCSNKRKYDFFSKADNPTRCLFTDKKKSLFVTVKTSATCYGLESRYPPTRIFIRLT